MSALGCSADHLFRPLPHLRQYCPQSPPRLPRHPHHSHQCLPNHPLRLIPFLDSLGRFPLATESSVFHVWRYGICDLETGQEKTVVLGWARRQFMGCRPGCKTYHSLPSVSATVLPRRDPPARLARLVTGDNDSSIASRLSNIMSPYSSYGSSNEQYISPDPSSSSLTSVITESSYKGNANQQIEPAKTKHR